MYCIYNKARRLYCRWDEKVIVFDTTDQAYEFMNLVPAFFAGEHNYVCIIQTNAEMNEDIENNADSILRYASNKIGLKEVACNLPPRINPIIVKHSPPTVSWKPVRVAGLYL